MPVLFYLIVALGVAWLVIRGLTSRAEARRAEAREQRMEALLAEQEALLGQARSAQDGTEAAGPAAAEATGPRMCLGCRTLNDPGVSTCRGCGLEL